MTKRALVLCPNVALATQAHDVLDAVLANSIDGHPIRNLSSVLIESDSDRISVDRIPDIIVSSTAQFVKWAELSLGSRSSHKGLVKSIEMVLHCFDNLQYVTISNAGSSR